MRRYVRNTVKGVPIFVLLLIASGCALGPLPPTPPGLFGAGISWIITGLLVWCAILLWKILNSYQKPGTDHLTDAINAINDRLTILEERMNQEERNNEQQSGRVP